MAPETIPFFLQQLAYQLPLLLVYLAGAIVAALMMRRNRAAALLCLVGCAVSLLTILAVTGLQGWLNGARLRADWPMARYAQAMTMVGLMGAILRPVGVALILVAVFVGRTPPAASRP